MLLAEEALSEDGCQQVGALLLKFENQTHTQRVVNFAVRLQASMRENNTMIKQGLFSSFISLYSENQHWNELEQLLETMTEENTEVNQRSINLIKSNLIYCFDNDQRAIIREKATEIENSLRRRPRRE